MFMIFPVEPRRDAFCVLKYLSEISAVGKTCLQGDIQNRQICCAQQASGSLDPIVQKIFKGRPMDAAAETAKAFTLADGGGADNIFQRKFFLIVLLNIGDHCLDAVTVGIFRRA